MKLFDVPEGSTIHFRMTDRVGRELEHLVGLDGAEVFFCTKASILVLLMVIRRTWILVVKEDHFQVYNLVWAGRSLGKLVAEGSGPELKWCTGHFNREVFITFPNGKKISVGNRRPVDSLEQRLQKSDAVRTDSR